MNTITLGPELGALLELGEAPVSYQEEQTNVSTQFIERIYITENWPKLTLNPEEKP